MINIFIFILVFIVTSSVLLISKEILSNKINKTFYYSKDDKIEDFIDFHDNLCRIWEISKICIAEFIISGIIAFIFRYFYIPIQKGIICSIIFVIVLSIIQAIISIAKSIHAL